MITMTITMNVRPEKRRELLQTLSGLLPLLKEEPGYRGAQIYVHPQDRHHLTLLENWNTQEDAERYMQSEYFAVLRGGLQLLTTSSNMAFEQVPQITGMKPILTIHCQECMTMYDCQLPMCA